MNAIAQRDQGMARVADKAERKYFKENLLREIKTVGNIAYIPLTQNLEAIVDADDIYLIKGRNWWLSGDGYAIGKFIVDGVCKNIRMHRIINKTPKGFFTDHINNNKLDNRKINLRTASELQNAHNRSSGKNNTSGFKGVSFDPRYNKWRATIFFKYKQIWLGYHESPELAHVAYCNASKEFHGDFGKTE